MSEESETFARYIVISLLSRRNNRFSVCCQSLSRATRLLRRANFIAIYVSTFIISDAPNCELELKCGDGDCQLHVCTFSALHCPRTRTDRLFLRVWRMECNHTRVELCDSTPFVIVWCILSIMKKKRDSRREKKITFRPKRCTTALSPFVLSDRNYAPRSTAVTK